MGCIKPCKQWDKVPIHWCRDFFHQRYFFQDFQNKNVTNSSFERNLSYSHFPVAMFENDGRNATAPLTQISDEIDQTRRSLVLQIPNEVKSCKGSF